MRTSVEEHLNDHFPALAANLELKGFQKQGIESVLDGHNTLAIMPTGGGKSLIYWLAGAALGGTTIVVSPLIALIDEQVRKLVDQGRSALALHSGIAASQQISFLRAFAKGNRQVDFLFLSPERLATDGFLEHCLRVRRDSINLVTIDEIHCVSQWGDDFRPFYKQIPHFLECVFGHKWPRLLGLTATLNRRNVTQICADFRISRTQVMVDDLIVRGEIELKALKFSDEDHKEQKLWELLEIHRGEPALVYVYRKYVKRGVEDLCEKAKGKGHHAVWFHGNLTSPERQDIIDRFRSGVCNVVFATNAFGMGIDIPNIKVVVHFMIPESMEQYYQEVGRSARGDGATACAYMLYSHKNVQIRKTHFINKAFPKLEDVGRIYRKVTGNKVGFRSLKYFDDEEVQKCLHYFLACGAVWIAARGFSGLSVLENVTNTKLSTLLDSTTTKGTVSTIKKANMEPSALSELVYSAVLKNEAHLAKPFEKCLIIRANRPALTEDDKQFIENDIAEKKRYKHDLLDYLVCVLDYELSSKELHQEMGLYLGVDKHKLGRIYKTARGELVRSKSEVIIANLLHAQGVDYEYERKVYYTKDKWIEPDFTVKTGETTYYWEHVGMIGLESYDKRWLEKLQIYQKHFPGKMRLTYESAHLSESAGRVVGEMNA